MSDEIRQLPCADLGDGCEESWERPTDDPDIRSVGAHKITLGEQPYWDVVVAVAEFLREDPLEGELRQQMAATLRAVDRVEGVWEDDREVWGVSERVSSLTGGRQGRTRPLRRRRAAARRRTPNTA